MELSPNTVKTYRSVEFSAMKEAEYIDWLLALLRRMNEAGGLARESSNYRDEVMAWLLEKKSAFGEVGTRVEVPGPYDGWGC
jgi:hypothetical protein